MKRQPLTIIDYNSLVLAYHDESDRSAIVLAGSFAEQYLATYLRHHMIDDPDVEQLFERGALASFDARIRVAYAFRLISRTQHDDLRLVKDIRNRFAHSPQMIDLQQKDVKAMIKGLTVYHRLHSPEVPSIVQKSERHIYLYTIGLFIVFAHNAMLRSNQPQT